MNDNKKLVVDPSKCLKCGFCVGQWPNIFDFSGEDDTANVVGNATEQEATDAVEACPGGAINIADEN